MDLSDHFCEWLQEFVDVPNVADKACNIRQSCAIFAVGSQQHNAFLRLCHRAVVVDVGLVDIEMLNDCVYCFVYFLPACQHFIEIFHKYDFDKKITALRVVKVHTR